MRQEKHRAGSLLKKPQTHFLTANYTGTETWHVGQAGSIAVGLPSTVLIPSFSSLAV